MKKLGKIKNNYTDCCDIIRIFVTLVIKYVIADIMGKLGIISLVVN